MIPPSHKLPLGLVLPLALQFLGLANPARAEVTSSTTPSIEVSGLATDTRLPDRADVILRIVARAPTAPAATRDVSARVRRVLDTLKNARVADADVESDGPSVQAEYEVVRNEVGQKKTEQRRQTGYSANYTLTAMTKDFDILPELLPQLAEAGALVQGVRFSLSDADARVLALEEQAVKNAVDRAQRLIRAAGSKPGRILAISTGDEANREVRRAGRPVFAAVGNEQENEKVTLPVRPGRVTIDASRTVTVEIVAP